MADAAPPIAALFLIEFDAKAGYTIVWKQADAGIELSGAVEYKSLPSGLHTVSEDLVYFVHQDGPDGTDTVDNSTPPTQTTAGYAGLSAFVNRPTDDAGARHARMIAVGVLVPRSYGRLGRAWQHAGGLLEMARKLAADATLVPLLEDYWRDNSNNNNKKSRPLLVSGDAAVGDDEPPPRSADAGYQPPPPLSASLSLSMSLPPRYPHRLSPYHPAWSLTVLLTTFGPLVFAIYRAALLRKRILISTHAPVREANNFVYILSVLANIPMSAHDVVEPTAAHRIRPLFTVGVNDIGFIMDDYAASKRAARQAGLDSDAYTGPGWIACTTDSILAIKGELWDVLITMPAVTATTTSTSTSMTTTSKHWPTVEVAKGVPLKATQRDLRRFQSLMNSLGTLGSLGGRDVQQLDDTVERIVEPVTWAALAYNGFMWWASAGEQGRSADEMDEALHDAQLLVDIPQGQEGGNDEGNEDGEEEERARIELATITYFHRLTTQMLSVLSDVVESDGSGVYYDEVDEEEAGEGEGEGDADVEANDSNDDSDGRQSTSSSTGLLLQRDETGEPRRRRSGQQSANGPQRRRRQTTNNEATAPPRITSDDVTRMGLDVWSEADAAFVQHLAQQYLGRRVHVESKGVEVCGLKVC